MIALVFYIILVSGRDDQPAACIVFRSFSDVFRQSTMVFTEQTGLEKLYGMVAYAYSHKRSVLLC